MHFKADSFKLQMSYNWKCGDLMAEMDDNSVE